MEACTSVEVWMCYQKVLVQPTGGLALLVLLRKNGGLLLQRESVDEGRESITANYSPPVRTMRDTHVAV